MGFIIEEFNKEWLSVSFQFPLWDSVINEFFLPKFMGCFQFPLWDSKLF